MRGYFIVFLIVGALSAGTWNAVSRGKVLEWADAHPDRRGTATVLYALGSFFNLFNHPLLAREYYRRIVERYPRSRYELEAHFELAASYEKAKEYHRAVAEYQKFAEKHPKSKYDVSVQNNISLMRSQYQ